MSGLAAYGPAAQNASRAFSPSDRVVVFDSTGAAEALRDCAARSFEGEQFFVRPVLAREYAARVDAVAAGVLQAFPSLDERRTAFEQAFAGALSVNGQALSAIPVYTPASIRLMQAAVRLSCGLICSTETERRRVAEIVSSDPPFTRAVLEDPLVPVPQDLARAERDSVVIWAPHLSGEAALVFAVALADLRVPLSIVCNSPLLQETWVRWFGVTEARHALSHARVALDASAVGSDAAAPLARWNLALAADVESGAQELLDGVRTFDRRRMESIFEAVDLALGAGPPEPLAGRPHSRNARPSPLLENGPLVSVLIPTFDRPTMLRWSLSSVLRQTYRNVETIVVIDGGPRVDDVAAEFPNVRFIHMTENDAVTSCNEAFAQANGEFVTFLNDDDLFFPHHVAELVTALDRSGGSVAHGDVLTAFLRGDDSEWLLYGFESNMSRTVEASSLLSSNQIGMTSVMFRRSCIEDDAPFDASIPLTRDYALWLRLASKHDFIHVPRITSCYTIRNRGAQQQSVAWSDQSILGYRALYAKYPVAGRPKLEQLRQQILRNLEQGAMGLQSEPAAPVRPVRWPLWVQRG